MTLTTRKRERHPQRHTQQEMGRPFLKHYQVVGRQTPDSNNNNPTVYSYEVFAPNAVVAKSRFWTLMSNKNKIIVLG